MYVCYMISLKTDHCFLSKSLLTGCLQAVALMGPMFGYLLGALVSKLYVDVGFVDTGKSSACFIVLHCVSSSDILLFLFCFVAQYLHQIAPDYWVCMQLYHYCLI